MGLLGSPTAQKCYVGLFVLSFIVCIYVLRIPGRWTPAGRHALFYFTLGLGVLLLSIHIATSWAAAPDFSFFVRQALLTAGMLVIRLALLWLAEMALLKICEYLGNQAFPHIFGMEAGGDRWRPDYLVILPQLIWYASIAGAILGASLFILSVIAYGPFSMLGGGALVLLALILGSWINYFRLTSGLRDELEAIRAPAMRAAAMARPDRSEADNAALARFRRLMEYRLGTREWNNMDFHRMADEPYGISYRFPGFLVGVETANRRRLGIRGGDRGLRDAEADSTGIARLFNDRKRTFVSHIVEFREGGEDGRIASAPNTLSPDLLFNAYEKDACDTAYRAGFTALDGLGKTIRARLRKENGGKGPYPADADPYTHIILFCMGWNTDQQESIRNYNSLTGYLADAAAQPDSGSKGRHRPPFRPLVVGISWPSEWATLKPLSYPSEADNADETGLVWGAYLIKRTLLPLKSEFGIPLVLIGHSFGTRVLSRAVASNPAWTDKAFTYDSAAWKEHGVDLFVGLQGAFSADRFVPKGPLAGGGMEKAPYAEMRKLRGRFIFTWSENDKANPAAAFMTGANHVGGHFGGNYCFNHPDVFWPCVYRDRAGYETSSKYPQGGQRYDPVTGWDSAAAPVAGDPSLILSLDLSQIVKDPVYGKGGKAHSDIYKPEIGRFLWRSILAFAPGPERL